MTDFLRTPYEDRDWYIEHMRKTMDWIEEKMQQAQEEAVKDPTVRKRGYDVGIYVEGRWLQQLIAESIGHYQMVFRLQRDLAHMAGVNYADQLFNRMPVQPIAMPEKK